MAKDPARAADSESVKATNMQPVPEIASFEDASTMRWLAATLAPARRRSQDVPTAAAVDRIRDRVFSDSAPSRARRSIAA
jgi:hypothetical protein